MSNAPSAAVARVSSVARFVVNVPSAARARVSSAVMFVAFVPSAAVARFVSTRTAAAISAATQDIRFNPVTADELDKIIFEVTVLTPPVEIKVEQPSEYLKQIQVGRDGLIVENSYSSGLLLPQVPTEYGWNVEEFLEYKCQKAGLEKDAWKDKDTKISRFQGVIFKEESPNGTIIRESSDDFL